MTKENTNDLLLFAVHLSWERNIRNVHTQHTNKEG